MDGNGDVCDACTIPPPGWPDPCGCRPQTVEDITIDFSSPYGRGSGLVSWRTPAEVDIVGFNVVVLDNQGQRIQINDTLIRPQAGPYPNEGATYSFIVPKHKSGRNIYIEMLRSNGTVQVFGPAVKVQ
jgi:hypothetical protein